MSDNELRQQIKLYLEKNERSQAWFAKKVGISRSFFNAFLNEQRNMSEKNKQKIISFLENN